MTNPVLSKSEPNPHRDYKPMTWERFLKIRKWAQELANEYQAPVYLVGSALEKEIPRDIDVSVIFTVETYEEKFSKIPNHRNAFTQVEMLKALMDSTHKHPSRLKAYFEGMQAIGFETNLDLKFCPETWWTEKDKMLIATPQAEPKKEEHP